MAETLWNNMVYTDVMQSDGFVVDYALCTTYSLDMPTLLSVPFLLGAMGELTAATMHSPHLLLEAINQSSGKFAVFCNAGCIAVPQANSKVYALLERSVIQVTLSEKDSGFVNFHPKVWVIKERNPDTGERQIKLIVLSRNLTQSDDLDIVCELVGRVKKIPATQKSQAKHAPLIDFLSWLSTTTKNSSIQKHISTICSDIQQIEHFSLEGSPFSDYSFFPMGIPNYDGYHKCLEQHMLDHAKEMLIISPFVDIQTLEKMVGDERTTKKTLITRHASLTEEILKLFNDGVYVPKEVLTDKVEKDIAVDLHEKVYFVHRKKGNLSSNHLYLGSTNATQSGLSRNVEFLLHLKFGVHQTSYNWYRGDLINDSRECIFERVLSLPEEDTAKADITNELQLRQAIATLQEARISGSADSYTITIHCQNEKLPSQTVSIYPLGCEGMEAPLADGVAFTGLALDWLTAFYVISIGELRRMVKLPTEGMPTEERDRAIFRSIINTKEKFINYLSFMLTEDTAQYLLESQQIERECSANQASTIDHPISPSLYEDMLRMAYANPERIAAIGHIIEKVDEAVVPEHFAAMYHTFEQALKKHKRL